MELQVLELLAGQAEHEVGREAAEVPRDGFVQVTRTHAVQSRQVPVEDDPVPANQKDAPLNPFDGNQGPFLRHAPAPLLPELEITKRDFKSRLPK
jgi:hypothetical protein